MKTKFSNIVWQIKGRTEASRRRCFPRNTNASIIFACHMIKKKQRINSQNGYGIIASCTLFRSDGVRRTYTQAIVSNDYFFKKKLICVQRTNSLMLKINKIEYFFI